MKQHTKSIRSQNPFLGEEKNPSQHWDKSILERKKVCHRRLQSKKHIPINVLHTVVCPNRLNISPLIEETYVWYLLLKANPVLLPHSFLKFHNPDPNPLFFLTENHNSPQPPRSIERRCQPRQYAQPFVHKLPPDHQDSFECLCDIFLSSRLQLLIIPKKTYFLGSGAPQSVPSNARRCPTSKSAGLLLINIQSGPSPASPSEATRWFSRTLVEPTESSLPRPP